MIIELVITYCLSASPSKCIDKRDPWTNEMLPTPMACMVQGQQIAQDFLKTHPAYQLARWGCEIDKPKQSNA